MTMHPRTTRLAYEVQPQYANVLGRVEVRIACPATRTVCARKALALARAQMQTPVAHLGGIRRWHQMHDHTSQRRFVRHELPQLEKGPMVATTSFCLQPTLLVRPLSNARQIFQGKRCMGRGSSLDVQWLPTRPGGFKTASEDASMASRQPIPEHIRIWRKYGAEKSDK